MFNKQSWKIEKEQRVINDKPEPARYELNITKKGGDNSYIYGLSMENLEELHELLTSYLGKAKV